MRKRRQEKQYFRYKCSITGQNYITTRSSANPDELVSVRAFYELHPDKDDRPDAVKLRIAATEPSLDAEIPDEEGDDEEE